LYSPVDCLGLVVSRTLQVARCPCEGVGKVGLLGGECPLFPFGPASSGIPRPVTASNS
jgi:hypothetical protein